MMMVIMWVENVDCELASVTLSHKKDKGLALICLTIFSVNGYKSESSMELFQAVSITPSK